MSVNEQARSYVDRFRTLLEQKAEVGADIADLRKEAKGAGFVAKTLETVAKREMESADQRAKRIEFERDLAALESALGAIAGTPLGLAAVARASGSELRQ